MLPILLFSAFAEESLPQEISLSEEIPLFVDVGLDSGWVPNSGSLGVRLELVANSHVDVEESGTAHLQWPEELNLSLLGEENAGRLFLETILETIVSIRIDIAGYQYEAPISTFDIPLSNEQIFDSFSLGSPRTLEASSDNSIVDFSTTVLLVVDVAFYGVVRPNVHLTFSPIQWDVEGEIISEEGASAQFAPLLGAESWDGQARYLAEVEASLNVDFVPTFEVCVPIVGCRQWEATQIPLSTNTDTFIHESAPVEFSFPLPALSVVTEPIDFGVLSENQLANHELELGNLGLLLISGQAQIISGSEYFGVYPEYFLADQGMKDGTMVSFLGATEGTYEGVLELLSNDPAQPSVQIVLRAEVAAEADDVGGKEIDGEMVGGCGCSSQKTPPLSLLILFPILVLYRRRV